MNLEEQHTIWGAPCERPVQAVGLLRAHAARAGFALVPVSPLDAAVAVVAAEAWWLAVGATSFEYPARHGNAALEGFCRILVVASGGGVVTSHHDLDAACSAPAPTSWFAAASIWMTWLDASGLSHSVMADAAANLAVGHDDVRLATMCSVLMATADD